MIACKKLEFGPLVYWELTYRPWIVFPAYKSYLYFWKGALIDCGSSKNRPSVEHILQTNPVNACLLTHHHEDHAGNISLISEKHVPIYIHPEGRRILESAEPLSFTSRWAYGTVELGSLLDLDPKTIMRDHGLLVMETPGHAQDHLVFYAPEDGILFSGDLYLGPKTPFFRSDELIVESIQSLRRMLKLDFDVLCCAHEPVLKNGKTALKEKLEFLETIYYRTRDLYHRGYNKKAILKRLPIKENSLRKYFSGGNFSAINMVSSVI
ncbi:MAG: MBL fold metallo-hydrolase, partial [Bacteroidota bacterium]